MKRLKLILMAILVAAYTSPALAKKASSGTSHPIKGHTTKNGTYVAPHHATNPNRTKSNNWSQKGNTNPYTGQKGTKRD
jgi:hypothetical protein